MNQLVKKLSIVRDISMYKLSDAFIIRNLYQNDKVKLKESSWNDRFKAEHLDMYPLDLMNSDRWCTYEDCADLFIEYTKEKKIVAHVRIYNGHNMDGGRADLKWTAKFILNSNALVKFKDRIEWRFDAHLDELYDKELAEKRRLRKNELGTDILNSIK